MKWNGPFMESRTIRWVKEQHEPCRPGSERRSDPDPARVKKKYPDTDWPEK